MIIEEYVSTNYNNDLNINKKQYYNKVYPIILSARTDNQLIEVIDQFN